jgi:hypothetical protein
VAADRAIERFADLTFEDFRRMASDDSLSKYEKIGFPDSYRAGFERAIFEEILAKLPPLREEGRTVLDIGPGCSDLPQMIEGHCSRRDHLLLLVDSDEMLGHFPDREGLRKFPGQFPAVPDLLLEHAGEVHAIIAYSVLHYVFPEQSVFGFLDRAIELLAPGGVILVGDIPNASKRRRFFASESGRRHHREFTGRDEDPEVVFNAVCPEQIDDSVVLGLVARARAAGCDAYVVPQGQGLPMANRREDLLVVRP